MGDRPRIRIAAVRPPDPETTKVVTAAILVAKAAARADGLTCGVDELARLDHLLQVAQLHVRNANTLAEDVTLDQHLESLRDALARSVASGAGSCDGDRCGLLLDSLGAAIDGMGASGSRSPSDGLDEIGDLFRFSAELAEQSYASAAGEVQPLVVTVQPAVRGRSGRHPVRATTTFEVHDRADDRCAEVRLDVARDAFGVGDDYFGLLAKVHHEVFVHALQAIEASGRRAPYGDACPLAEGMVDAAAHACLVARLRDGAMPPSIAGLRHRFRVACEREHVDRHRPPDFTATTGEKLAHEARNFGRMVFEDLLRARGGGAHAAHWVETLALRLNVRDLTARERRQILMNVHTRMHGSVSERIGLFAALETVRVGGSPVRLL